MKIVQGDYTEMECDLLVVPVPSSIQAGVIPSVPANNLIGASTSNALFSKLPAAALIWGARIETLSRQASSINSQLISIGGYLITPPLSGGQVNKAPYDVFALVINGYGYNLAQQLKLLTDCVDQNSFGSIVIPRYYDADQAWNPVLAMLQSTLKDDKYSLVIP